LDRAAITDGICAADRSQGPNSGLPLVPGPPAAAVHSGAFDLGLLSVDALVRRAGRSDVIDAIPPEQRRDDAIARVSRRAENCGRGRADWVEEHAVPVAVVG
jgi:hypothetical protein